MSIRQNFPTTPPSLVLDFANSKTLDPRITFSRTNPTATRMNELGLIVTAAADEPRFDHEYDASTGVIKSLGLLVEESRSNYFTQSIISNWSGTPINGTKTGSAGISPDNTNTATLLEATATDSQTRIENGGQRTPGTTYTLSCFCKAGTVDYCTFGLYELTDGAKNFQANFYLTGEGTVTYDVNCDATITPYTNGWYRCTMTITLTAGASYSGSSWKLGVCNHPTAYYAADIGDNVYFWGAQLEVGAFPTSYIPTSGSTATRNPDTVTMTGDNFSDWYNPSEGTFYVSSSFYADGGAGQLIFQIDNGSNANRNGITFRNELSGNQIRPFDVNYSASPAGFDLWTHTGSVINTDYKTAFALKSNDMAAVTNYPEGSLGLDSSTSRILQEKTTLRLGSGISNISPLNGHISKLTYYPTRLSNDQLQTLTK